MVKAVRRTHYLELLHAGKDVTSVVKVITGMRRCGKSTLLDQYMDDLRKEGVPENSIFSINFESFYGQDIETFKQLNDVLKDKISTEHPMYIFLDEIQEVKGWEKSIAALSTMKNCDVYITGSNSNMLSSELSTHISGRYIEIRMLPLSFKEYVEMHESKDIESAFANYLKFGSLPEVHPERGERFCYDYLEGTFNTILVKDVLGRTKTKDKTKVESIARFIYSNIGNITNISKIAEGTGISHVMSDKYISTMVDSLLFYQAEKYDIVGKKLLATNGKYYATDLGMRNSALKGADSTDISRPLENIIFLELIRRGYTVRVGSYRDAEIDFAALKGDVVEYYQVTLTMLSEKTKEREFRSLEKIKDNYTKTILTLDRIGLGSNNGIHVVNVFDWLLGDWTY